MLVQKSLRLGLFSDISLIKDVRRVSGVRPQTRIQGIKWSRNSPTPGDEARPPNHLLTYFDELCPRLVQIIFSSHPSCNASMASAGYQGVHARWGVVSWSEEKELRGMRSKSQGRKETLEDLLQGTRSWSISCGSSGGVDDGGADDGV